MEHERGHELSPLVLEYFGDLPVLRLHEEKAPTSGLFWKRVLDVTVSTLTLLVAAPLMAAIALAIKMASPGPVLYRAKRVGLKGRRFTCYKFRTMVANADRLKDGLRDCNERQGPCFKIAADPRITHLGRFLRRYSLDELPQLWNVVRGEMSLVGPRPHPLDDFEQYRLDHLRRLDVTPGITGLWQVTARRRSFVPAKHGTRPGIHRVLELLDGSADFMQDDVCGPARKRRLAWAQRDKLRLESQGLPWRTGL